MCLEADRKNATIFTKAEFYIPNKKQMYDKQRIFRASNYPSTDNFTQACLWRLWHFSCLYGRFQLKLLNHKMLWWSKLTIICDYITLLKFRILLPNRIFKMSPSLQAKLDVEKNMDIFCMYLFKVRLSFFSYPKIPIDEKHPLIYCMISLDQCAHFVTTSNITIWTWKMFTCFKE